MGEVNSKRTLNIISNNHNKTKMSFLPSLSRHFSPIITSNYSKIFSLSCIRSLGPINHASGYHSQTSSLIHPHNVLTQAESPVLQQVRGIGRVPGKIYYKGNAYLRIKKHGYEKRTSNKRGLVLLWKRFLKGRHELWK